jgi:hypothetical protein
MEFNNILSDISNINLVILGISITIFTVVYSFLINKKQELIKLSNNTKINGSNPQEKQLIYFFKKYTNRYTKINNHFIKMAFFSFTIFIFSIVLNRFFFKELTNFNKLAFWTLVTLTTLLIIYFIATFIKVIIDYKKDITI